MPEIACPHCGEQTPASEESPVCQTCRSPIAADFIHFDTGVRPNRGLGFERRIKPSGMRVGSKLTALILGVGIVVLGTIVVFWVQKRSPSNEWTPYYPADGRFRVDLPKGDPPIRSDDVVDFDGFPPAKRYSIWRIRTHEEYGVSYFPVPPEWPPLDLSNLVTTLDENLQVIQQHPDFVSSTVKEWRTLGMAGQLCRELTLDFQLRNGLRGRMWARTLLAEGHIYTLVVFQKDDQKPADPERFFTSFVIH